MAAAKSTLPAPFESVSVQVIAHPDDTLSIYYIGPPEDLVSAGCCTLEMIQPGKKGQRRVDHEGHRYMRMSLRRGRRFQIARILPTELALTMPGVAALAEDAKAEEGWPKTSLRSLTARLRQRYRGPAMEISAFQQRCDGSDIQTISMIAPPSLFEHHGLATEEWLAQPRDGRRRREVDEYGVHRLGGMYGEERAHLVFHTPIDPDDPERFPGWAEREAQRIVRRLLGHR